MSRTTRLAAWAVGLMCASAIGASSAQAFSYEPYCGNLSAGGYCNSANHAKVGATSGYSAAGGNGGVKIFSTLSGTDSGYAYFNTYHRICWGPAGNGYGRTTNTDGVTRTFDSIVYWGDGSADIC